MPLHDSSTLCESKGGKWSEQSKLCAGIDDFTCTVSGGRYNGCDNQYVDENGTVKISPTGMCMSTCQFK